ncbi:MAG: hypothetical protein QOE90_1004 [Thermoplasmata archaeon]|nr:hypothetical protein [Thermoplasmata archaeon]
MMQQGLRALGTLEERAALALPRRGALRRMIGEHGRAQDEQRDLVRREQQRGAQRALQLFA